MNARARLLSLFVFAPLLLAPLTGGAAEPEAKPEGAAESAEATEARELVTRYLTSVRAKKWAEAKKLVHPKTLTAIAERKKRLGKEDHPMSPATFEKTEFYLKEFRIVAVKAAVAGTQVVETSEDNFQVEEKGLAEGDMGTYLVGKSDGKWYVVDKKRNETFSKDSIKLGYKGYFDKLETKAEEE